MSPSGPDSALTDLLDDHADEIQALVVQEAVLAYEAHEALEADHPDAAAAFAPPDLLPQVDDALERVRERTGDDGDLAHLDTGRLLDELDDKY